MKHRYETDKHYGIIPPAVKSMSEDRAKHILAYDIIYCNKTYDLDRNLSFKKLTPKEKKLREERLKAAQETLEKYLNTENHCRQLDEAVQHYNTIFVPGTSAANRTYGHGKIVSRKNESIHVQFDSRSDPIKYDFYQTVTGHFLNFEDALDSKTAQQYEKLFRCRNLIQGELKRLQKELEGYRDVLE